MHMQLAMVTSEFLQLETILITFTELKPPEPFGLGSDLPPHQISNLCQRVRAHG